MNNLDTFRSPDHPKKIEPMDVRKEAEEMVQRHERQLMQLKLAAGTNSEAFQSAALKATEQFQHDLKEFLKERGTEELLAEIDASVHAQISKIMAGLISSQ